MGLWLCAYKLESLGGGNTFYSGLYEGHDANDVKRQMAKAITEGIIGYKEFEPSKGDHAFIGKTPIDGAFAKRRYDATIQEIAEKVSVTTVGGIPIEVSNAPPEPEPTDE